MSDVLAPMTVDAALTHLAASRISVVPVQTLSGLVERHRARPTSTARFEKRERDGWETESESFAPSWFAFGGVLGARPAAVTVASIRKRTMHSEGRDGRFCLASNPRTATMSQPQGTGSPLGLIRGPFESTDYHAIDGRSVLGTVQAASLDSARADARPNGARTHVEGPGARPAGLDEPVAADQTPRRVGRGPIDIGEFAPLSVKTPDADFVDILAADDPAVWRTNPPAKTGDTCKLFQRIIAKAVAMKDGRAEPRAATKASEGGKARESTRRTRKRG